MEKNKKYIIVKGCAGLGNRLYTLSWAIDYAVNSNRILLVDWRDGQFDVEGVNAFSHFFELKGVALQQIEQIDLSKITSVYPAAWEGLIGTNVYDNFEQATLSLKYIPFKLGTFFKKITFKAGYWKHLSNTNVKGISNLFKHNNFVRGEYLSIDRTEQMVVFVDFSPLPKESIIRKNIKPRNETLMKIDHFVNEKGLAKDTVGIHIRYTDKKPDKSFEKLYEEIDKVFRKGMKLFLSTDNKDVISLLQAKYEQVIVYPKYLPEELNEGLHQWALYNGKDDLKSRMFEESIIDMWLLSRCEYLIYQKNSSFSNISSILKDDDKIAFW